MIIEAAIGFVVGMVLFLAFAAWRVRKNTESGYYDSEKWEKHHGG